MRHAIHFHWLSIFTAKFMYLDSVLLINERLHDCRWYLSNSNKWLQTSFYDWKIFFWDVVLQLCFSFLRKIPTVYEVWNLQIDRKCVVLQCLLWVEDLCSISRVIYMHIVWTDDYSKVELATRQQVLIEHKKLYR